MAWLRIGLGVFGSALMGVQIAVVGGPRDAAIAAGGLLASLILAEWFMGSFQKLPDDTPNPTETPPSLR